jgi:phosphoribosylanthranilate isomerase
MYKSDYTRIKICCINSIEEAETAIKLGASAVGLVSEMPSGPGVITEDKIAEIAKTIPPSVGSFLLTSKTDVDEIIKQQKRCCTNTIQLCDSLTHEQHYKLRSALPGISIVQVIHVWSEENIREAIDASKYCNGLLLDSGNPKLSVKELGGTGRTHNWEISRLIVETVSVPVFLAGGLNVNNVGDGIKTVKPFGVDICSGVRTNGLLDEKKLTDFISAIKNTSI